MNRIDFSKLVGLATVSSVAIVSGVTGFLFGKHRVFKRINGVINNTMVMLQNDDADDDCKSDDVDGSTVVVRRVDMSEQTKKEITQHMERVAELLQQSDDGSGDILSKCKTCEHTNDCAYKECFMQQTSSSNEQSCE